MRLIDSIPKKEGYYMPAEFARHDGCIMIWPERPGSWPHEARGGRKAFADVIKAISKSEKLYLAVSKSGMSSAKSMVGDLPNVEMFMCETDDAWARDVAPTFVINNKGERRAINWEFNAWGGEYNGLYPNWDKDNAFAQRVSEYLDEDCYDARPFVLEGGSIHTDGEGTIMVTESCLLSLGRNPKLSKDEIEKRLLDYLGGEKVIWLPKGIYQDETDEHVDNVCAFIKPGEVCLAWTDDVNDPQYAYSVASLETLENSVDARGRKIKVHKLPIPKNPVCINEYDLSGYVFEDGEDEREVGERLAASYVNFYFSNGAVILPAFGGENVESDENAAEIMRKLCPNREIIQIDARDILVGGGNIHCITQQIPSGFNG